jgi:hypothetical protein
MSEPRTYKVTGFAAVPWECEIHVEAVSEAEAREKARAVFERERQLCLVARAFDTTCVHSFEPGEATILK